MGTTSYCGSRTRRGPAYRDGRKRFMSQPSPTAGSRPKSCACARVEGLLRAFFDQAGGSHWRRLLGSIGKNRPLWKGIAFEDKKGMPARRFDDAYDKAWRCRVPYQISRFCRDRAMRVMFSSGTSFRKCWGLPVHPRGCNRARWIHGLHELAVLKANDMWLREQMNASDYVAQCQGRNPKGHEQD